MLAEQVASFILSVKAGTKQDKIHWSRFPNQFPRKDDCWINDFINANPNLDGSNSYFFASNNGFVFFIQGKDKEKGNLYAQLEYGLPILDLTSGFAMSEIVDLLGEAIQRQMERNDCMPDGLYHFLHSITGCMPRDPEDDKYM